MSVRRCNVTRLCINLFGVQSGTLTLEIDHIPMRLEKDEIVTLTPLHYLEVKRWTVEYPRLYSTVDFYCIYGHDNRGLFCNGFLFMALPR